LIFAIIEIGPYANFIEANCGFKCRGWKKPFPGCQFHTRLDEGSGFRLQQQV